MKRVGIYSGTFDPIHNGHVQFALEAQEKFGLEKVFFLVEPRPRRKQGVKALEHRTRMVELAIKQHTSLGLIILNQARFTAHETLPVLQARFRGAELYVLMGEDMLDHLADWPHVAELIQAVHFVIGIRRRTETDVRETLAALQKTRGLRLVYSIFQAEASRVSSSSVRSALRKGKTIQTVPEAVLTYIAKEQLYTAN